MEKIEYRNIYENEEKHFFYLSTHRLVVNLIKKWSGKKNPSILDAGCGTGGLCLRLALLGKVSAMDASPEAIKFARKRGVDAKLSSIEKIPFRDRAFDIVTCIDVIYHRQVVNDVAALGEIKRVLKPGGILIIRVPANPLLMSVHDRHVHTARRYGYGELVEKIKRAGLLVKQISYVHSPVFLMSLIKILIEKITNKKGGSSVTKTNPLLNRCLLFLLDLEGKLIARGISPPFGQGLIAVATR